MAATGKKSKKAKWIPASITDIIAEPTTIPATHNWADSVDEEPENTYGGGGYSSRQRAPVVLPSASRAARGGLAVDDESIPRRPPFTAHISNLPYDVDESAITELFTGLKIINLRVPREGDRLKGYGCVDFEDRESLINAMNIPDLTIGGRRIRIEVSTQDNDRRMGRGGRSDRDREYDPERTMGDWRSGPRAMPDTSGRERPRPERGPMDRSNMDRGNMDRDRDRDRERDSSADNRPGGWRDGDRPAAAEPARTPYGGRDSFGRDRFEGRERGGGGFGGRDREDRPERSGYGGRDGFRTAERDGGGFGGSREGRGFGGRNFGDRDRDRERDQPPREDAKPRERPKLNLLPRTVPRDSEVPTKPADGAGLDEKQPEKVATKPVSAEKVFGAAKPVDTAAKEREIEERLRKQEEEARRGGGEEKERWGRRNDHSGERRAAPKRDERPRDARSYNRDRRDYSKDDKDRRDYKDDRDRRDYRDDRDRRPDDRDKREPERRDYKDDRDRRDYKDDRAERREPSGDRRREYSGDRRPRRDYSGDRRRDHSGDRRRDYSGERRDSRDDRDYRDGSRERRPDSREREKDRDTPKDRETPKDRDTNKEKDTHEEVERERDDNPRDERNGRPRPSRSRDRHDEIDDKTMPKMKEQEKPNFVASNKFSFLEDADDGVSD